MTVDPPVTFERRTRCPAPLFGGTVQAGFPSPADDYVEKSIDLNEQLVRNPTSTFFVRAKGDSMKDAGITSGDILVVDKAVTVANKQIVVAMLNGEFTVKRLRKKKGQVFLESENQDFPPMEITPDQELVIWGVVTYVIHQPK
jgi:DNA polymerase V